MSYNKGKTKARIMELRGRIWPPVVRFGVERVQCDEWVDLLGVRDIGNGFLWIMRGE